jgi:rhomboid protease GluP
MDSMPDGVRQYKASWRSTTGSLTLFLLFMVFLFVVLGVSSGGYMVFGACAVPFAWVAWLLGKPLFNGDWVLRIGPRGISGHALKNRTIPWRDVRDVNVETVQGHHTIVLTLLPQAADSLAKTRGGLSGRKLERRIPLTTLRKQDVPEAITALQETFALRGGANAAAAAEARQQEAQREASFEQELARTTQTTWALHLVVGLNVGVWLLNVFAGISPIRPATSDLFRWGAISAWAVTRDHEYWRLLTGTFLHGGFIHLGMNMLGLWGAGKLLNRLYGNGQFLLVYFLSAIAGASASLHFSAQTAVSVGASGAVFGVVAALVVAVRKHREQVPKALAQRILSSEMFFLAYSLFNGFMHQGIDNAAHVGGLVAGAAMGWALVGTFGGTEQAARMRRAGAVAAALLVSVGAMVGSTPAPRVDHAGMFAAAAQLQQLIPKAQAAHAALQKDVQETKAGRKTEAQLLQAVETVHLPALRRVHAELVQVPRAQGTPLADMTTDMKDMTATSIEGMELQIRAAHGQARPEDAARAETLKREMQLVSRRLQERLAAMKAKPKP